MDLLLRDTRLVERIQKQTGEQGGWQALIKINQVDQTVGVPIKLGDWATFEIKNLDFDLAHRFVRGKPFWVDPNNKLMDV